MTSRLYLVLPSKNTNLSVLIDKEYLHRWFRYNSYAKMIHGFAFFLLKERQIRKNRNNIINIECKSLFWVSLFKDFLIHITLRF